MNKCVFTGIIYKQNTTQFQSGAFSKTLWIEELREKPDETPNKIKVDFNGYYAKEVPNTNLQGCEVAIFGKLVGKEGRNDSILHNIRGTQLMILAYPRFEQEIPQEKYEPEAESRVIIGDDDLPF